MANIQFKIPFHIRLEDTTSASSMTKKLEKYVETMIENPKSIKDTEFFSMDKDDLFEYINNLYKEPLRKFAQTGLGQLVDIEAPCYSSGFHNHRNPFVNRRYVEYELYDDDNDTISSGQIDTDWKQRANSKWIYKELWILEKQDNLTKRGFGDYVRKEEWKVKE